MELPISQNIISKFITIFQKTETSLLISGIESIKVKKHEKTIINNKERCFFIV